MDLRGPPPGCTSVTDYAKTFAIPWQLAAPGTEAPTTRCYWVLPSRLLAGAYPPPSTHDPASPAGLTVDALWRTGIRTFINLVEESERNNEGKPFSTYVSQVRRLVEVMGERATCMMFSVRDLGVPTREQMRSILDAIDLSLDANRPVYVHCFGGVGRTGTVVGCWLRRHHLANADDVIAVIATLRNADVARRHRSSPETAEQIAMVRGWDG